MIQSIKKLLVKDLHIEARSRIALALAGTFSVVVILTIGLISRGIPFSHRVHAILFWLIVFFSAMNALAHIFIREEEEGTALFLRLHARASHVFIAKLLINTLFFTLMMLLLTPLFVFFLQIDIPHVLPFLLLVCTGSFSLVATTTLLGAMVAQSGARTSLFTIVSIPIVLPALWAAVSATEKLFAGENAAYSGILFLLAFSFVIIAVSALMFKYIWHEA